MQFLSPSATAAIMNRAERGHVTVKDVFSNTESFEMDSTKTIKDLKEKIVESKKVWKFSNTNEFRIAKGGEKADDENLIMGETYFIIPKNKNS